MTDFWHEFWYTLVLRGMYVFLGFGAGVFYALHEPLVMAGFLAAALIGALCDLYVRRRRSAP